MTTPLFADDLGTIELFLAAMERTNRHVVITETPPGAEIGRGVDVHPPIHNAFGHELVASMRHFLRIAWGGAHARPGVPATWPYACDQCKNWMMQTTQRSRALCPFCGTKGPRRRLLVPWAEINANGRPL